RRAIAAYSSAAPSIAAASSAFGSWATTGAAPSAASATVVANGTIRGRHVILASSRTGLDQPERLRLAVQRARDPHARADPLLERSRRLDQPDAPAVGCDEHELLALALEPAVHRGLAVHRRDRERGHLQGGRRCRAARLASGHPHLGAGHTRERIALRADQLDVRAAARRPQHHARQRGRPDDGDRAAQRVRGRGGRRLPRAARRHAPAVARGQGTEQRGRRDHPPTGPAPHWTLTMWRPSVAGGAPPDADTSSMVCGPACVPDSSKIEAVPARSEGTETLKLPKVMLRGARGWGRGNSLDWTSCSSANMSCRF